MTVCTQVVRVMRVKDLYSDNVLACAARRGNDSIIRAVWETMRRTTEDKEKVRLFIAVLLLYLFSPVLLPACR